MQRLLTESIGELCSAFDSGDIVCACIRGACVLYRRTAAKIVHCDGRAVHIAQTCYGRAIALCTGSLLTTRISGCVARYSHVAHSGLSGHMCGWTTETFVYFSATAIITWEMILTRVAGAWSTMETRADQLDLVIQLNWRISRCKSRGHIIKTACRVPGHNAIAMSTATGYSTNSQGVLR